MKADAILEDAKFKAKNQFAGRVSSLQDDLLKEGNLVTQAESMLSTFKTLK